MAMDTSLSRPNQLVEALTREFDGISPLLKRLFEVDQEKKIARIKEVREHSGLNLKDAKEVMDKVNHLIPSFADPEDVKNLTEARQKMWSLENQVRDLRLKAENYDVVTEEADRLRRQSQRDEEVLGRVQRELTQEQEASDAIRRKVKQALRLTEVLLDVTEDKTPVVASLTQAIEALLDEARRLDYSDDVPF